MLSFRFYIHGSSGCEEKAPENDVVLEFAPIGATVFKIIWRGGLYLLGTCPNFIIMKRCRCALEFLHFGTVSLRIPVAAKTAGTLLRWRQLGNSSNTTWMLDDIVVTSVVSVVQQTLEGEMPLSFSEDFDSTPNFPYVRIVVLCGD